jgi:hypothetical protein
MPANDINIESKGSYSFINDFYSSTRKKFSLNNPLFENFNVHQCLYIQGKINKNLNLLEHSDRLLFNNINPIKIIRIVGYVQIDEQLYLR